MDEDRGPADRASALCSFLRFLSGSPDGDAAARSLALGALAPLGVDAALVYAHDRETSLELIGNYGFDDSSAAAYRVLSVQMPLPVCEAFTTMQALSVPEAEMAQRYPLLRTPLDTDPAPGHAEGHLVVSPILLSGVPIGAVALRQCSPEPWEPGDWQYLDGASAALAMWMDNQREILVDRWRRAATAPHREVRISERQREILELVGLDRTNAEIGKSLGYSVPTIKKDLQHLMRLLGTHDRRSTAGRAREFGLLPERRARD